MARNTSRGKTSKDKTSKGGTALTHIDTSGEARMVDGSASRAFTWSRRRAASPDIIAPGTEHGARHSGNASVTGAARNAEHAVGFVLVSLHEEEPDADLQASQRRCRTGHDHRTGNGTAGNLRARLLRVFLSERQLSEQGTWQSLHRQQL